MLHSAAWNDSVDLAGKRVAVIGGGSSAVQIVPNIQPGMSHQLSCLELPNTLTKWLDLYHASSVAHRGSRQASAKGMRERMEQTSAVSEAKRFLDDDLLTLEPQHQTARRKRKHCATIREST